MKETYATYEGLFRFGLSPRMLLNGETLRRRARMKKEMWKGLSETGALHGASSILWYGSVEAIEVKACVIERMDEDMKWGPTTLTHPNEDALATA